MPFTFDRKSEIERRRSFCGTESWIFFTIHHLSQYKIICLIVHGIWHSNYTALAAAAATCIEPALNYKNILKNSVDAFKYEWMLFIHSELKIISIRDACDWNW